MTRFKNVVRVSLYQRIRNTVYEREDEWNLKKVEDVPGACDVYAIRYNRKWISELVSFQEVSELTGETPLFIASQTGSGKTTFIFNNCLPVAEREGKKALYLCNRVALKNQIKKEAMKNPVNKSKKVDGRKVGEYREFLTDKGISSEYRFGLIDIHTYQEMLAFPKSKVEEYSMVIMDEAHFFLSDAPFNAFTQVILDKIVSFFRRYRRIYLSATPQECMSVVYEAENSILSMAQAWVFHGNIYSECFYKPGLNVVIVDEDYSYLRPRFFEKNEEIIDIINKDTESKWLIFIRKKELRKELVSKLNIPNNDIAYYDAETDKELEQYKMLIEDEKLSHRVTISTKVLDVGINIKSEKVNVVTFEDDPIEIKQMVGRKRAKSGETVLVYFFVPTISELKQRQGQICNERNNFRKIADECNTGYYQPSENDGVYMINGVAHVNPYRDIKYRKDFFRYEDLIYELSTYDSEQIKYEYARYILSQFYLKLSGIEQYFYSYEPTVEIERKLRICVKPFLDREISKEKIKDIAEEIFKIVPDPRRDKRSGRNIGIQSLNKALEQYNYRIESMKTSTTTCYKIMLLSNVNK